MTSLKSLKYMGIRIDQFGSYQTTMDRNLRQWGFLFFYPISTASLPLEWSL